MMTMIDISFRLAMFTFQHSQQSNSYVSQNMFVSYMGLVNHINHQGCIVLKYGWYVETQTQRSVGYNRFNKYELIIFKMKYINLEQVVQIYGIAVIFLIKCVIILLIYRIKVHVFYEKRLQGTKPSLSKLSMEGIQK